MILNLSDAERRVVEALSGGLAPDSRCGRVLNVGELADATGLSHPELRTVVMDLWKRGLILCLDGTPWRPESDCMLCGDALAVSREAGGRGRTG